MSEHYTAMLLEAETKKNLVLMIIELREENKKLRAVLARAGDPDVVDEMLDATGTYCPPKEIP